MDDPQTDSGEDPSPRPSGRVPVSLRVAERMRRFSGTAAPQAPSPRSVDTKAIVDGLDRRERYLGGVAIGFALLLVIVTYAADRHSSTKSVAAAATFFLVSNLVFTAILALGLLLKRRALLGFGCFFFGLEMSFSYKEVVLGVPFIALGGWLIMRANRKQKLSRPAGAPRQRAASTRPVAAKSPKASKRYTPPKRSARTGRR